MKTEIEKAVKRVIHAASKDPTRENLYAVHFESDEEKTEVVATDGHRMSLVRITPPLQINRTVTAAVAKQAKTEEELPAYEYRFPDFRRVIPDRSTAIARVTIPCVALRKASEVLEKIRKADKKLSEAYDAFRSSNLAGSMDTPSLPTSAGGQIRIDDSQIEISIPSLGYVESAGVAIKPRESTIKRAVTIGINLQFIVDATKTMPRGYVTLYVFDELAPIYIEPEDQSGFEVIMPMRL